MKSPNPKIIVFLALAGVLAASSFLFTGCGGSGKDKSVTADSAQNIENKFLEAVPDKVVGLAKIDPEGKTIDLYPQVSGSIEAVKTKLSDIVQKGQVLFVIDHATEEANISKIQAQMQVQQAVIKNAAATLAKMKANAANAEKNYARVKKVYDQGADTKANLDDLKNEWTVALTDVTASEANVENARASLTELKTDLLLAQIALEKHFIKAPANGIILEVNTALGAEAGPGISLGSFAAESPMDAVTEIDELFADKVKLDQFAFIRKQGASDTLAEGRVVEVAPSLRQKSLFSDEVGKLEDRRVREVKVRLTKGQEKLLYGQRVECVIDVRK